MFKIIKEEIRELGLDPKEELGKEIVSVFKSKDGKLAIGLFDNIYVVEDAKRTYSFSFSIKLEKEMLGISMEKLLSLLLQMYQMAEKNGYKIREGRAFRVLDGG